MNLTAVLLMTWWCGFVWTFTHPKPMFSNGIFWTKWPYSTMHHFCSTIYIYIIYTYVHLMYVTSASLKWYVYTIHIHILIYRHMEYISWYQICIHHHVYSIMIHYCQCTSWYVMGPALRTMDYSSPLVVNEIQVGGWWLICGLTYFVNTANWDRWYVTQTYTHTHSLSLSLNTYVHTYIIYIYLYRCICIYTLLWGMCKTYDAI